MEMGQQIKVIFFLKFKFRKKKNEIESNQPIFIVKVIKNTTTQKNFNYSKHYSYEKSNQ